MLNESGKIANQYWLNIPTHFDNILLDEFVVMPSHVHGIIIIQDQAVDSNSLEGVDSGYGGVGTLHATSPQDTGQGPQAGQGPQDAGQSSQDDKKKLSQHMSGLSPKARSISVIIRSYKAAVTKQARQLGSEFYWQSRFHDHIIRNQAEFERIKTYIIDNPANWKDDQFFMK